MNDIVACKKQMHDVSKVGPILHHAKHFVKAVGHGKWQSPSNCIRRMRLVK